MITFETLHRWALERLYQKRLRQFGGTQCCPYCSQLVQLHGDWSIKQWERDPFLDVITCGPCGGKSLWRFELGMFYIGPLEAPKPKSEPAPYYDIENARIRASS